jgi:alpha-beta hydrolase superfamily lysophospholipase
MVRLGKDTLAVENASFAPSRATGVLRLRNPLARVEQTVTLTPASAMEHAALSIGRGARGDSAVQRLELTQQGDSVNLRVENPNAPVPRSEAKLAVPAGVVPFTNLSGMSIELILRRARALGRDTATVRLLLGAGQVVPAIVTWRGADSVQISISGVALQAKSDRAGRFLGAVVPSQGVVFERLSADSPVTAWTPVPTSYAAPAGASYTAQDISFRTPAGIRLAGTLTMPPHRAGARVPAVVLITGSGAQDRDEAMPTIGEHRPFREIADTLSRRGIAVLRLDDRGVGGSDAGPPTATTADFADDIRAAVAWLRAREDVDSTRVGLVGHSEGGIIAPMVAATDRRIRAIVLIAAPAKTGREIMAFQRRDAIQHDSTRTQTQRDSLFALSTQASDSLIDKSPWMRFFRDYDPLPTARRVRARTLILQGETDRQVSPDQARTLANAMRAAGNARVTLRTFPRLNHLLIDDPSGDPRGYTALHPQRVRKDFLGALANWLAVSL